MQGGGAGQLGGVQGAASAAVHRDNAVERRGHAALCLLHAQLLAPPKALAHTALAQGERQEEAQLRQQVGMAASRRPPASHAAITQLRGAGETFYHQEPGGCSFVTQQKGRSPYLGDQVDGMPSVGLRSPPAAGQCHGVYHQQLLPAC